MDAYLSDHFMQILAFFDITEKWNFVLTVFGYLFLAVFYVSLRF